MMVIILRQHCRAALACVLLSLIGITGCVSSQSDILFGTCLEATPESALHPLRACLEPDRYVFISAGMRREYVVVAFREALKQEVTRILRRSHMPAALVSESHAEIWLIAPLFTPERPSLLAVIRTPQGNFALGLDLDIAAWSDVPQRVLWLGSEGWPSLVAREAGRLEVLPVVTLPPGAFRSRVEKALAALPHQSNGASLVTRIRGGDAGLEVETLLFAETIVKARLDGLSEAVGQVRWPEGALPSSSMIKFATLSLGN